jgi:hypothetical protein
MSNRRASALREIREPAVSPTVGVATAGVHARPPTLAIRSAPTRLAAADVVVGGRYPCALADRVATNDPSATTENVRVRWRPRAVLQVLAVPTAVRRHVGDRRARRRCNRLTTRSAVSETRRDSAIIGTRPVVGADVLTDRDAELTDDRRHCPQQGRTLSDAALSNSRHLNVPPELEAFFPPNGPLWASPERREPTLSQRQRRIGRRGLCDRRSTSPPKGKAS